MLRHLFQLGRLQPCSGAFLDLFPRWKSAIYHTALVAEGTDNFQSLVYILRDNVFLQLGGALNNLTSCAEYTGQEIITMS
jgi:hypothetical protein